MYKTYQENEVINNYIVLKKFDNGYGLMKCLKCGQSFERKLYGLTLCSKRSCPKCYDGIIKDEDFKKIYKTWSDMKQRCYYDKCDRYKNYGGRGIKVCDEWLKSFKSFYYWSINNGYSKELSIDRIDVNGNYEPSNCRWITLLEQASNKTNNIKYNYKGKLYSVKEIAQMFGLTENSAYLRIRRKWDNDKISQKYAYRSRQK